MSCFKRLSALAAASLMVSSCTSGKRDSNSESFGERSLVQDSALADPLPAREGVRVVTPEFLLSMAQDDDGDRTFSWLGNDQLVYTVLPNQKDQTARVEIINVHTGTSASLAEGSNPIPSPDGKHIAFVKGEGDAQQIYLMRADGSQLKQLTKIEGGISGYFGLNFSFAWSANSKELAISYQPFVPSWESNHPPKTDIFLADITTHQMRTIASIDGDIPSLSWFPNGEELLFVRQKGFSYPETKGDFLSWVEALTIRDAKIRTLAYFDDYQQYLAPHAAPDGKMIAVAYNVDHPYTNSMMSIGLIPYEGPAAKPLTRGIKLRSMLWSDDSKEVYAIRTNGPYEQIYSFDVTNGKSKQITNGAASVRNYALSPDGSRLAWISADAYDKKVLQTADSSGNNLRQIAILSQAPVDLALGEVREIQWITSDYPNQMRGLLYLPLHYKKGKRYPLIVDLHGGGIGAAMTPWLSALLVSSPLEWAMWNAKGYAVFVPEYRSSGAFGSLAISRDHFQDHDIINCDMKDVNAGIDQLISEEIVDPERMAIIGHSAGARRANWLVATSHRFKAIISKEGWAEEYEKATKLLKGPNPPTEKAFIKEYGGLPWEVPENYLKNSALAHCQGATTPTLFLMGNPKFGGVDYFNSVHDLYECLKKQKVETEFKYYADEGHVFYNSENRRELLELSIHWIDGHLKN